MLSLWPAPEAKRIPVVLLTDIGDDIDDTWALGLLLQCSEFDLKLIVTDYGKAQYRARIIAKFLQETEHERVPIGLGPDPKTGAMSPPGENNQAPWIKGFELANYRGKVHQDGVKALIDTVMRSREQVTILAIGPVTTLAAALEREPRIATKARVVGMHGSVRKGYGNQPTPSKEYNVERDIPACQKVFRAAWPMLITPLDTCGLVSIHTERYKKLLSSRNKIVTTILANYAIWEAAVNRRQDRTLNPNQSSTLFDTAAVYLALADHSLMRTERLKIAVNDQGFTVENPNGKEMEVALAWNDLGAFHDFLVERLMR
ncbi:MAG: nucleoside hydrolase [Fimbriimonas sp.]